MKTTVDVSWPGGRLAAGEHVPEDEVPSLVLERWKAAGVVVDDDYDGPEPDLPTTDGPGTVTIKDTTP